VDGKVNPDVWFKEITKAGGGPQFGDLYLTDCHNWMYAGGAGLVWKQNGTDNPVNWIEMGGGGTIDMGNPRSMQGGYSVGGQVNIGGTIVGGASLAVHYGPSLAAMSPGCNNQATKPTEPIHIFRIFKDDYPRCDPQKQNCQNPADVCLGNGTCKSIEKGMLCWNKNTMKNVLDCGKEYVCRTCTQQEATDYGWITVNAAGYLAFKGGNVNSSALQSQPCWQNASVAIGSNFFKKPIVPITSVPTDPKEVASFRYCLPKL